MNTSCILNNEELEQIVNIAKVAVVGRTISALEMLLNEPIECESITASNFTLDMLDNVTENNVCSVYINGKGDINVALLLLLNMDEAKYMAGRMIGIDIQELDELSRSAISELGNILLVGSFVNALANITDFKIECGVPGFAIEAYRSIIEYIFVENCKDDSIVAVYTTLICKKTLFKIHIVLLLNPEDAKKLLV